MPNYFKTKLKLCAFEPFRVGFLMLCLMCMSNLLRAQAIQVTGVVTDLNSGELLPGVHIMVQGSTTGTVTNSDGTYKLNVPSEATLVFSYVGYVTEQVPVSGKTEIRIALVPDITSLDDVVVIGYGTVPKRDLTGAVSSVGEKVLKDIPLASTAEAMTGRLAGVQITTTEGSPDADIKIRVRGGGSITQDNSPLYIVDGFPVSNISNIPPTDIQSIDVLKDASSTAIYGSRGANGVVIITTKEGKEGKIKVNFNSYVGVKKNTKEIHVLNPYEYVRYQYELDRGSAFQNYYGTWDDLEIYKSVKGHDWQDEVFGREAKQQYYNLSVNGGSKTTRYNLSLTRNDEESIMIGSGFERNNIDLKMNTQVSSFLSIDFNNRFAYTVIDGAGVNVGSGATTRLRNSVKYAPTKGLREFDSNLLDEEDMNSPETVSLLYDPVQSTKDEYKQQRRFSDDFNAAINLSIMKGLKFRSEWGYGFDKNMTDNVWGPATSNAKNLGGQPLAQVTVSNGSSWRTANTLTYDLKSFLKEQNINILIGQEITSSQTKSITNESHFFPVNMSAEEVLAAMSWGTAQPTTSNISQPDRLSSFFGRINYSAFDKYLLTVTLRADGSSKFAKENRWGYFPSVALAWRISEESFLKSFNWLSNLKVRASYGTAGNNRIPTTWKQVYTTGSNPYYLSESPSNQLVVGSTLYNPKLKWETTVTRNLGVDFGLFASRVTGTLEFYKNTTRDLLIAAPMPSASGYSSQYQNIGRTSNKGVEITLEGTIIQSRDFLLAANFNIGFNKNKVDKYKNGENNYKTYSSGWNGSAEPLLDYIVKEGDPVGQMYGYVTDGMYSFDDFTFNEASKKWIINTGVPDNSALTSTGNYFGPGALKYKDISGPNGVPDGLITDADKTIIGDANPKHTGGFGLTAKYKNIDFSAFFNWVYGNKIYNANKIDYTAYGLTRKYQNIMDIMDLNHRFTTIDPATGKNIYSGNDADPDRLREVNQNATIWHPIMTQTPLHSWAIEDGSFLRINNVTVGYTLPKKWFKRVGVSSMRFYVTGYNLYVFTNYSGNDPEVSTRNSTQLTPGADYSGYPKGRSFIGGINLTF